MRRRTLLTAAALPLAATPRDLRAQEAWPPRHARILVPFAAGRVTDLVARILAEGLRDGLGTTAVVENRPGANAVLGLEALKRAAPDGATLLVGGLGSHGLPPAVMANWSFDPVADFTPIGLVAEFVNVMVVPPELPARSVAEFIALARARPGALNYGFTSVGASNQLTAELFRQSTGTELTGIPFGATGNSLVLLQRGDVQVAFENLPTVAGAVRGGTLRALAVTSPYRTDQLPEVPTMQEAGLAGFAVTSWIAIYAPPAMPADLRARVENAVRGIMAAPGARQRLASAGFEPAWKSAAELASFQASEIARWRGVVRAAGLQLDG
ncbi:Bug family tripartite tricarboxylate transporter substrate binding protein [Roseicella aerolata]|uniref:Tripartite tricarboxylate transporter substrate binding protein n=1 Tax=Roseicella aerolata TaxID=2883479 RepID=A0A9X1LDN4_9PROT|nr:tripartite tricarboxylate transporter substrate binding protein [Roseicella aerolata]MCB4825368.1 tripartite tricarboxylate transporter substrate binding protein [Roseicella aerolata]